AARRESVHARTEALIRQPFRLECAPLFRAELLRLDKERFVFVFVFHHLILDGYYLPLLLRELAHAYDTCAGGQRQPSPALPLQYGDFAVWQEGARAAGAFEQHHAFWQHQLRQPLPSLEIAGDRQPASARTFENGSLVRRLPDWLSGALEEFSRRHRTTPFRIVAAAFQVLLSRLTGQNDVLLAIPFSIRPGGMEATIGCFSNTLPLRTVIDRDAGFERLIADFTAQLRAARGHCAFPLVQALRGVGLPHDPSRPTLPICISQVRPFADKAGDLRMTADFVFARATTFDLWLIVATDHGIEVAWQYAAELFDAPTIGALVRSFEALLTSIIGDAQMPIRELELLAASDRA